MKDDDHLDLLVIPSIFFQNCVLALYLLTIICQTQKLVIGAPYDGEDHNAIIVIPFKSTDDHVTKIESYKVCCLPYTAIVVSVCTYQGIFIP